MDRRKAESRANHARPLHHHQLHRCLTDHIIGQIHQGLQTGFNEKRFHQPGSTPRAVGRAWRSIENQSPLKISDQFVVKMDCEHIQQCHSSRTDRQSGIEIWNNSERSRATLRWPNIFWHRARPVKQKIVARESPQQEIERAVGGKRGAQVCWPDFGDGS